MLHSSRKESINTSIIFFVGVAIGICSTIFIYPKDLELYGFYGFLTNTASLLVPFVSLGFSSVLIKYFPAHKNSTESSKRFFGSVLFHFVLGITLFALLFILSYDWIKTKFLAGDSTFHQLFFFVLPITILYVMYELLSSYCINFFKTSPPALLTSLMKIFLPTIFLCCVYGYVEKWFLPISICLFYILTITLLFQYLKRKHNFSIEILTPLNRNFQSKDIYLFAFFNLLGGTGSALALRLDSFMLTSMSGTEANGIFSLAYFISNASYIPATSINSILDPKIARLSFDKESESIEKYYKKSAILMFIPSVWICSCILFGLPILFEIMPNQEKVMLMAPALVFLLCSRLFDAVTGVNHAILSYSNYYKIEAILMLIMAGVNIALNYFLIPKYGITGAAISTCISVFLFNFSKSIYIWNALKIQPFSFSLLKIIGLSAICFFSMYFIEIHSNSIFSSGLKVILFTSLFSISLYSLGLSLDYNQYFDTKRAQLLKFLK